MNQIFLPTNKKEMKAQHIEQVDFVMITGDAYVDHPSFGSSLIARHLQSYGYSVAIIAQPSIKDEKSVLRCGIPRLGFLVTAGNIDSMVNHYYVSKHRRKKDAYSLNDKPNKRPDDATIVYCKMIRNLISDANIIIGGIEASLRRFSHYDYIKDTLRPSILVESQADLLVYGMGERAIIQIAEALESGMMAKDLVFINGTSFISDVIYDQDTIILSSYEEELRDVKKHAQNFLVQYRNNDAKTSKVLAQPHKNKFIIQNPAMPILKKFELDAIYKLPFTYESYDEFHSLGKISALSEVKFSIAVNRGCNGGCHFCAITYHQGQQISMRSHDSVVDEAKKMKTLTDFKGYIHDVGGPTANFNDQMCDKLQEQGSCRHRSCFAPKMCPNLKVTHDQYFAMLKSIRELDGIKKVFVRSGIRYDYMLKDQNKQHLEDLVKYHVSGQLRLAPEHVSPTVLKYMNKPSIHSYNKFCENFEKVNKKLNTKQYIVPYLMSSHPGSELSDALELALYLKKIDYRPLQVQDFYPTPSTMSSVMYYTGLDPMTMKKVSLVKSEHDRNLHRALLQFHLPQNHSLVCQALKKLKREDLINNKDGLVKINPQFKR